MKKQWHIRTRALVTLISLTVSILLAVALTFNISVREYIRRRVAAQLSSISGSASEERRTGRHKQKGSKFPQGRPDRITGTMGSVVLLEEDGTLASVLNGNSEIAGEIEDYFSEGGIDREISYRTISLESGKFAVSVAEDPAQEGCYLVSYVDVTSLLALTAQINMVLLIIIFAAILLSVFLSRRFARSLAGPVQELSDFAREIGEGKFEARELSFGDVEFGELARSMNRMASELQEEKHRQEIFFQNVSHELRTPLTSIRGNAEGILYGVMEPQSAAGVILSESDRLGGMVEDILYLSRMGKAQPEGEAQPLDLREIISQCASDLRTEAENRGVKYSFDFAEDPVLFPIRDQDARRLFGNLISNAVRYAASEIRLTCRTDGGEVVAVVADNGEGISPEDMPHIFERFYRGRGGKHGIGLSIASSIVNAYRGSLKARSEKGAEFEVRFRSS